jgi:hypothetical protein
MIEHGCEPDFPPEVEREVAQLKVRSPKARMEAEDLCCSGLTIVQPKTSPWMKETASCWQRRGSQVKASLKQNWPARRERRNRKNQTVFAAVSPLKALGPPDQLLWLLGRPTHVTLDWQHPTTCLHMLQANQARIFTWDGRGKGMISARASFSGIC